MLTDSRLLAAARILSGLSQTQLAEAAGVYRNAVQRIEAGSDPRASTLKAIVEALAKHGVDLVGPSDTHVGGVMLRLSAQTG